MTSIQFTIHLPYFLIQTSPLPVVQVGLVCLSKKLHVRLIVHKMLLDKVMLSWRISVLHIR